jgi:hypothetical protein
MVTQEEQRNILEKADAKLDEIADFLFSKSQENIVEMEIIDEGTMLKSGYVNRAFLEKEVGYSAPYSAHLEFGTDPHFPPIEPIQAWAKRKLGLTDEEAKKAAWAICKTIEKEGSEPRPFFRDAIEATKSKFKGELFGT